MENRDEMQKLLEDTLRELITEQSEGEWGDALIEKDVKIFTSKLMEVLETIHEN